MDRRRSTRPASVWGDMVVRPLLPHQRLPFLARRSRDPLFASHMMPPRLRVGAGWFGAGWFGAVVVVQRPSLFLLLGPEACMTPRPRMNSHKNPVRQPWCGVPDEETVNQEDPVPDLVRPSCYLRAEKDGL